MEINPYQATLHGGLPAGPKTQQWRPTLLGCLAVIGIIGVLIALLLPARRSAGPAARRIQCSNNLKQIALALHSYEDRYGALPPAHTVDAEGKPLHSWRTLILPFMEHEPLYQKIDLSKPWDDPANKLAFDTLPNGYGCPSANCPMTHTVYMSVALPGGCFKPTEPRKLSEITDDHSSTLMVMEVDEKQAVHWMSPTDAIDLNSLKPESGARFPHQNGFQALFVDFSVHFLNADLKPETLRALITIDGKDVVGDY
jgi:type II secretory pathway pseudopilin PulG